MTTVGESTVLELVESVQSFQRIVRCVSHLGFEPDEPGMAALGVLSYVSRHEPVRASEIARWLGVGPAALSRHVADLQGAGMLVRETDPQDARAQLLRLTDEGRAATRKAAHQRAELLGELLADWDEDQTRNAIDTLERLRGAIAEGARRRGSASGGILQAAATAGTPDSGTEDATGTTGSGAGDTTAQKTAQHTTTGGKA